MGDRLRYKMNVRKFIITENGEFFNVLYLTNMCQMQIGKEEKMVDFFSNILVGKQNTSTIPFNNQRVFYLLENKDKTFTVVHIRSCSNKSIIVNEDSTLVNIFEKIFNSLSGIYLTKPDGIVIEKKQ